MIDDQLIKEAANVGKLLKMIRSGAISRAAQGRFSGLPEAVSRATGRLSQKAFAGTRNIPRGERPLGAGALDDVAGFFNEAAGRISYGREAQSNLRKLMQIITGRSTPKSLQDPNVLTAVPSVGGSLKDWVLGEVMRALGKL